MHILVAAAVLCVLLATQGWACDQWPVETGVLVRQYQWENGLTVREFDTDADGVADYATATQPGAMMPLFYSFGLDNPHDTTGKPFYAFQVYIDRGGKGRCEDIQLYLDRMLPPKKVPV